MRRRLALLAVVVPSLRRHCCQQEGRTHWRHIAPITTITTTLVLAQLAVLLLLLVVVLAVQGDTS